MSKKKAAGPLTWIFRLVMLPFKLAFRMLTFLYKGIVEVLKLLWKGALSLFAHVRKITQAFARQKVKKVRFQKLDLSSVTDGFTFEEYVANLLRQNGYRNVEVTKKSGDYGVDILAHKDGSKYAVQCKLYSSPVGNKAVQEVYAGKAHYACDVAVVATNNTFSRAAHDLAKTTGTLLWDRDRLIAMQRSA